MPTGGSSATGGSRSTAGSSATGGSKPTGGGSSTGGASTTGGGSSAPGVRIVGRTTQGTSGTRFEWPGVYIQARFSGTQVSIQLDDGGNKNQFAVVIDGGTPTNLTTASGKATYSLATGLADTTHDLLVWRRTEAYYNATEFLGLTGFSSGGALLAPPAPPDKRIEIIGDSISCGYGNEGASSACSGSQTNENNYLAYGSVAARSLGADVFTEAWSGIGIYRNYNEVGPSTDVMPTRYDYIIPTETTLGKWDFAKYQPHVVVINLTSNDFSTHGDPGQPYIDGYVKFVQHLRSVYPNAYIICVIEWTSSPSSAGDVNQVVSTIKTGGDTKIESYDISSYANSSGCDGHPNIAGDKTMGDALAAEIKKVMSW
jgi:lysophospholipase L1-like esterase